MNTTPAPASNVKADARSRSAPLVVAQSDDGANLGDSPTLRIAETFLSIQGEGTLSGVPSWFIRVSGCNLRCGWCDTPYASWMPEGEGRPVRSLVESAVKSGARHVVVTGGEPMLFPAIVQLCDGLRAGGIHVTIETAGTVYQRVGCDLMSLSPKLSTSLPGPGDPRDPDGHWRRRHDERRLNLPVLQRLLDEHSRRQIKFVITGPSDIDEVDALLSQLHGWVADDIMLMPEGVVPPSAHTRAWLAQVCIARGWRFAARLHIELFGNTRGT